jgi:hypothetical protein
MLPDLSEPLIGAEFPHDNPELFGGPGWLAVEPCGRPRAIASPSQRHLHYQAPCVQASEPRAGTPERAPGAATVSDFDRFLAAVRKVMCDTDPHAELLVVRFLREGVASLGALTPTAQNALVDRGFASRAAAGCQLAPRTEHTAEGWRRLLLGQAGDLAACGDTTLDDWASAFVGACLGYDLGAIAAIRRALRQHGVAAFGMANV